MSKKKKIDTKHLFHAISHLNVVPVWYAPTEDAGMISQMLFGETCNIIQKKNKHWYILLPMFYCRHVRPAFHW